ncbi:MAG: ABC transporter ATP-binding protein [Chloroflexi bacterium]|nr:ABC transporter ATP-binding protein [Chloroflexota bacterium]
MLRLSDIYVSYGGFAALNGLSCEVIAGELVTIVGANGAGKTTLLKTISGLLHPTGGTIELEDQRIDRESPDAIVRLGIIHVPEGRRLFQRLTVAENLKLGAYTQRAPAERARAFEWVYELFPRLAERRAQRAGSLSGGEQQMCAIARGLMARPRLLMLDEPSLGIAPRLLEEILQTLAQLRAGGLTILLVEQHVVEALELADRAYVLQTGQVVLAGTGADLLGSDLVRQAYLAL